MRLHVVVLGTLRMPGGHILSYGIVIGPQADGHLCACMCMQSAGGICRVPQRKTGRCSDSELGAR